MMNQTTTILLIATSLSAPFLACQKHQETVEKTSGIRRFEQLPDSVLTRPDSLGRTVLHHAAAAGDTASVSYLLKRGLDVDPKDNKGMTPLHVAVQNKDNLMIRHLISRHADVHAGTAELNTPLYLAAYNNDIQTAEMLYFNGAYSDAFKTNHENLSPLTYAVRKRYYSIAEMLYWPLHYIVKRDEKEHFEYLLRADPDYIHKKDMKGMTPLHIAFLYENSYFIEKLMAAGADPLAMDQSNRKPADYRYADFTHMVEKDILENAVREKIDDKMFDFLVHYDWMTLGLIKEGEIAYLRAYGQKNMIHEDAVYASVSKPVTSIIFMQLLNMGMIESLDANIARYSKKYRDVMPSGFQSDSITFKHLLTHRSGIPHLNKPLWINGKLNLQFRPGTEFLYSTNGFGVLGEILEEITGRTYSELVTEYIGKPVQAGSFRAEPHFRAPGARVHSTTLDFARFARGVINHQYISEKDLNEVVLDDYQGVGLAWGVTNFHTDDVTMMHAGSNGKPRAYILLKPKKRLGVVLMGDCNTADDIWFVHLGPILMDILENKGFY